MPDLDKELEKVEEGQSARLIRHKTEDWLLSTEEDIMANAVVKYRADQLTDANALCIVAEISSLRRFREYLEDSIRIGTMAAERSLGQDG